MNFDTPPLTLTTETPINRAFQAESEGVRVKKEKKFFFIRRVDELIRRGVFPLYSEQKAEGHKRKVDKHWRGTMGRR